MAYEEKLDFLIGGDCYVPGTIQPMTKEFHLFDTFVAGTTHLADPSFLETIQVSSRLSLLREDNKFYNNAVIILTEEKAGQHPGKNNVIFARLMDAGKLLVAKIAKIEKRGSLTQISIGIYLVDF